MFEIIGVLLAGAAILIKNIIKYCGPIILVVAMFFIGGSAGSSIYEGDADKWDSQQIDKYTHKIVIDWNDGSGRKTEIYVREDCQWNINGAITQSDIYYPPYDWEVIEVPTLPAEAIREGKIFIGLYENPNSGSRIYADASGNGLLTVKRDMILYAQWEVLE